MKIQSVTAEQAQQALKRVIEATRARGRKGIRLHFGSGTDQETLVAWMWGFVRLNAEDGVCAASRIEALRHLNQGKPPGMTFKDLRTDLTDRLEELGLVESLDPRRIRLQLLAQPPS